MTDALTIHEAAETTGWKERRKLGGVSRDKAYGIGLGCGGFPPGAGFYFPNTTSAHSAVVIKARMKTRPKWLLPF